MNYISKHPIEVLQKLEMESTTRDLTFITGDGKYHSFHFSIIKRLIFSGDSLFRSHASQMSIQEHLFISLPDFKGPAVNKFLSLIYNGTCHMSDSSELDDLLEIIDHLDMEVELDKVVNISEGYSRELNSESDGGKSFSDSFINYCQIKQFRAANSSSQHSGKGKEDITVLDQNANQQEFMKCVVSRIFDSRPTSEDTNTLQ